MIGDSSEFGPVDLLGALAVNAISTNQACKHTAFRWGIKKRGSEEVKAFLDYRFLGGIVAAGAAQMMNDPRIQRVGHDVATGLLGSYVATETCRKAAEKAASHSVAAPPALDAPATAPQGQTEGAQNYVYGW